MLRSMTEPVSLQRQRKSRQHFGRLLQLLLLSIATSSLVANPVSSPEISNKVGGSGKTPLAANSVNVIHQQQHQQQQQQQHQQQQQQQLQSSKLSQQEAHLNTLSAYAAGYDTISDGNFKPSYKLPDMETNFKPIQNYNGNGPQAGNGGPLSTATPVIMQYLPQTMHEGGVQYLQLIPTRPLIVPISPYLSAGGHPGGPPGPPAYHPQLTAENAISDYNPRPATMIAAMPANAGAPMAQALVGAPPGIAHHHLPYALHTYTANTLAPYRPTYRFNRDIRDKHMPAGLTLNLNEYLPGPHDGPHPVYIRGRP